MDWKRGSRTEVHNLELLNCGRSKIREVGRAQLPNCELEKIIKNRKSWSDIVAKTVGGKCESRTTKIEGMLYVLEKRCLISYFNQVKAFLGVTLETAESVRVGRLLYF